MTIAKRMMAAVLIASSAAVFASPAFARSAETARNCLLEKAGADGKVVLLNLRTKDFAPSARQRKAFNFAMSSCERKHSWTRKQTSDAGAHAGFVLRFKQLDAERRSTGMTESRRKILLDGALLFHSGPAVRDEWGAFNQWLQRSTGKRFGDFRKTSEFPFFEAYVATLASARRFESD